MKIILVIFSIVLIFGNADWSERMEERAEKSARFYQLKQEHPQIPNNELYTYCRDYIEGIENSECYINTK